MNNEIEEVEKKFQEQIAAIPKTESNWEARIASLKNVKSTKQSVIRRKYGVSLRMRDSDKKARTAAGITPPKPSGRFDEFRAPHPNGTPISAPNPSTFSPINNSGSKPTDNGLAHANGHAPPPPKSAEYSTPSGPSTLRRPHAAPHAVSKARETVPIGSGFGVLKATNHLALNHLHYQPTASNKRRRTSEDGGQQSIEPRSTGANAGYDAGNSQNQTNPTDQPHDGKSPSHVPAMMPVRAEDAASKFNRKSRSLSSQRREKVNGRGGSSDDAPTPDPLHATVAAAASNAGGGSIPLRANSSKETITINSSSESETEPEPNQGGKGDIDGSFGHVAGTTSTGTNGDDPTDDVDGSTEKKGGANPNPKRGTSLAKRGGHF